jgi:repressor LexA
MKKLTTRQQQVLQLVQRWLERHQTAPTRAEIAQALGMRSPNAAEDHLRALASKGYLRLNAGRARNIELLPGAAFSRTTAASSLSACEQQPLLLARQLPLIGRVAAGAPILAVEHVETYLPCPSLLFTEQPDYLLRVRGDSMRDACIHDGDLLFVHRTEIARNNAIMVLRLEDEVTVKTLVQDNNRLRLLPANDDYQPIELGPEEFRRADFSVEGLVVGVLRTLP